MAKNYFKSYIWLLETLQSRGHLTLKELQSLWLRSSVNDEEKELAPRTFSNHLQSILDIFGIEIKCDRADNSRIADEDIPTDLDVLVTHYPPMGILDEGFGSPEILNFLLKAKPVYHLFGHVHKTGGENTQSQETKYQNISVYEE